MAVAQALRICPARDCAAQFFTFPNGGNYRRITPVIAGERPQWVKEAVERQTRIEVAPPEAAVAVFEKVVVHAGGIITTLDHRVVFESLINTHHEKSFYNFERAEDGAHLRLKDPQEPVPLPGGETYVHIKQSWDSNYGHWLIESLPRVDLAKRIARGETCKWILTLVSPQMARVYRQTMATFGVEERRLILTDKTPVYCERLVYPLPLTRQPWVKAPIIVPILRQVGERLREKNSETSLPRPERLFIERPAGMRRQLLNQAEIRERLERRGYTAIKPGAHSCAEQAILFSRARQVVGTIGAELANLVFCENAISLLALAPAEMLDDFYLDLLSHLRGRYFSLHGLATEPEKRWNSDFRIDPEAFEEMLSRFEGE